MWESAKALKIALTTESDVSEEVSEEPAEESKTPDTSDNAALYAVVALVTILGAAIVVKARKA